MWILLEVTRCGIETNKGGVTLIREAGDKRIGKESTVVYHMRNLLNQRDGLAADTRKSWKRFNPSNRGLTACRLGVWNPAQEIAYWHERYAIENAAEEFNKAGRVWFMAA